MNHAKKHMEYDRIVKGNKKGEFFFEDEEGRAVGMLIEKQDAKKTKKWVIGPRGHKRNHKNGYGSSDCSNHNTFGV